MFDWDDPTRYEWVIHGHGARESSAFWKFLHFTGPVIGPGLIIPAISYVATALAIVLLALVSSPVLYAVGIRSIAGNTAELVTLWTGVFITIVLIVATGYMFSRMWLGPPKKRVQTESHLHELLGTSVGIIAFVMSNLTAAGFEGSIESLSEWLRFFVQEAMRVILLDIPEVFDIRLSNIEASTWHARLELVFFRFLIAAGLISSVLVFYRRRFRQEVIIGTVKECFWKCQNLLDRDTLRVKREGRVDPLADPESVPMVDFLEALDERDYRDELAEKHHRTQQQ